MARQQSPDSVSTRVGSLGVNETIVFDNPYSSVMVMVCMLKKHKEHEDKIFKIKVVDYKTSVTRVK